MAEVPKTNRRRVMRALPSRMNRMERHSSMGLENLQPSTSDAVTIRCVGNYDLGRTIGKGRFGKVKLATHVLTGATVAIKIINKKKMNQQALSMVQREIRILKQLSHPNIIQLYEVLETERVLFLIMEHASGGEALDFVVTHGKISEDRARVFFQQIVSSLAYCHKNGIVHRDLKAENLLLDEDLNIKLIDFGLANFVSSKKFNTPCGSPNYAAPEIILKKEYNGPEVDIWCMGVVLFVFLCGRLPFKAKDMASLFQAILCGDFEIPENLTPDAVDLLKSMLEKETTSRITIEGILNHPWVCKNNWRYTEYKSEDSKIEYIDQNIAKKLETYGFSVSQVLESLRTNQFNQATATFNLLSKAPKNPIAGIAISRTRSEFLGKYVGGPASTPTTAANSPACSLNPSPAVSREVSPVNSPDSLFGKTPPKESFSAMQQRRIAQARKTRGHKRTRSDLPFEIIPEPSPTETECKEQHAEPVKRAQSESIEPPESPLRAPDPEPEAYLIPEPLPPPQKEEPTEEPLLNLVSNEEDQSSWVMMAPKRGHRRSKSEDRTRRNISISTDRKMTAGPATQSLWSSTGAGANMKEPNLRRLTDEEPVRRLTEQEIQNWKATEESERQQISTSTEDAAKPFNSILSWTKKMLSRKQTEPSAPRECRTTFSSSTTSRKHPKEIMLEIKRVLDLLCIEFENNSPYCLKAHCPINNIQFEVEVCIPPNLTEIFVIRLRRISGDWIHYKDKCQAVLENLEL